MKNSYLLPKTMRAMVTMGHGGIDKIVMCRDWPIPTVGPDEVIVRVSACGLNNTDVNTRVGWYSSAVVAGTSDIEHDSTVTEEPSWGGSPIEFPRIQGADICGEIVTVGANIDPNRIGERIISDNWLRDPIDLSNKKKTGYLGSECDGGFAEYACIPSRNALVITSDLVDAELATFSCSYSTAEGMLCRVAVEASDTILVTGASGGVGGALVQLAKMRGARVIALAGEEKHDDVKALGADRILGRAPASLSSDLKGETITVVADVVGGKLFSDIIDLLKPSGRYVCSGAIAGPMATFDLRTLYLRDLTFTGSTVIGLEVMPRLIRYIETGAIRPALAAQYKLEDLHEAQNTFISKKYTGNIVVCP